MIPPANTYVKNKSVLHKLGLCKLPYRMSCDYRGDGFGTKGKSLQFMEDPKFKQAWDYTAARHLATTGLKAPDVRWRAHTAIWAAQNGLRLEGDFVECGVFTGLLSMMICRYFGFENTDRNFWLFDTWSGVPVDGVSEAERKVADGNNKSYYHRDGVFEAVTESFAPFPHVRMIQGMLPETLAQADIQKIAYLSIDLNNADYEKACIDILWPKLSTGAVILLDDYGFAAYRPQQEMWDNFAAAQGRSIATLPTGQGILIK
ncbi:MAG: methyltransferase [Pseudomonadota bacterium]|nr:methyltransferase [Pseudomonadota bacterium]QKK04600.1 MAG: methyltransferase [Pseudomonadota bacterium]